MRSFQRLVTALTFAVLVAASATVPILAADPNSTQNIVQNSMQGSSQNARATDQAVILNVIRASVNAVKQSDERAFAATFAPQATITDDIPPFHWMGTAAPHAWYAAYRNFIKQNNLTDPTIAIKAPLEYKIVGSSAYESLPASFSCRMKGETMQNHGMLVFSLVHVGSGWKITSVTWAGT